MKNLTQKNRICRFCNSANTSVMRQNGDEYMHILLSCRDCKKKFSFVDLTEPSPLHNCPSCGWGKTEGFSWVEREKKYHCVECGWIDMEDHQGIDRDGFDYCPDCGDDEKYDWDDRLEGEKCGNCGWAGRVLQKTDYEEETSRLPARSGFPI